VVEKSRLTRWCEIQIRRHEHAKMCTPHPHHLVNCPDEVLGTVNDECGTPALGQRDAVRSGAVTLNGWALECCFDVLGRIGRIHGADEFVRIGSGQSKGIRVTGGRSSGTTARGSGNHGAKRTNSAPRPDSKV
jgi:hypothetical protein